MLKHSKAFSGFAVDDLAAARTFYQDVLGLDVREGEMGMLTLHLEQRRAVLIYPKPDHVPASFTILNFPVPDIEAAVGELRDKGVTFEQYDGDLKTDSRGICSPGEGPRIAWFRDPAGNILSVIET